MQRALALAFPISSSSSINHSSNDDDATLAALASHVPRLAPRPPFNPARSQLPQDDERLTRTVVANLLRKCGYSGERRGFD